MMNPDECRKAFEAKMARDYPNTSLAWDMDYNEYVFDEANHMYSGFALAWNARTESKPVAREWALKVLSDQLIPFEARVDKVLDALQLSAPLSPVVPGVEELVKLLEEFSDMWDEANDIADYTINDFRTAQAQVIRNHLLATGGRESREDRYRQALESIKADLKEALTIDEKAHFERQIRSALCVAEQALATTNVKEPS